jgi:transcriptional regulator with XRE-family HTH domain
MSEREKFLQHFGRRIRAARILKGLTLQECARQAGMSYSNLSMIERGRRSMYVETLPELAKVLGKSVQYFLLGGETSDEDEDDEHAA